MIKMLFGGGSLLSTALMWTAILSVVGGTYAYWHHSVRMRGYNQCIAAIAAKDTAAIGAAIKARDAVDACERVGGVWDSTRGQCDRR